MITVSALDEWVAFALSRFVVTFRTSTLVASTVRAVLGSDRISEEPILAVFAMSSVGVAFAQSTISSVWVTSLGVRQIVVAVTEASFAFSALMFRHTEEACIALVASVSGISWFTITCLEDAILRNL